MPDPDVMDSTSYEYYKQVNGVRSDYGKRSQTDLIRDVNIAHDFIKKLVHEKDQIRQAQFLHSERELKWRKILWWALGATWALIGWLIKFLLPYAVKGMAH